MQRQRCGVCREVRSVKDFHRRSKGGKRSSRCRFCTAVAIKESRERARDAWMTNTPKVRPTAADLEVFEVRLPSLAE